MPILIKREDMPGGMRRTIRPQNLKSGTYFGQMQLRGSILTIKDSSVATSGFMSFGTSMVTIPTSPTTGTGVYIDYSGIYGLNGGVQTFKLDSTGGTIVVNSGTIGGFEIGTDYIRDVANSFGLASTITGGDDVRQWAGATFANRTTAPFRVYESGAVVATSATISGTITATAGSIGGWTITSTDIRNAGATVMLRGAGNLAFGSTPPTSASTGTGLFLDSTGVYGLDANVVQFSWLTSNGKAAGGVAHFDANGITLDDSNVTSALIKWVSGTDYTGTMGTYSTSGEAKLNIDVNEPLSFDSGRFHLNVFETGGASAEFRARCDEADGAFFTFNGSPVDMLGMTIGSHAFPRVMLDVTGEGLFDQGSQDDAILTFHALGDIAHGMTDYFTTDTYGAFSKSIPNVGGLSIQGISETLFGLNFSSYCTTENADRSTGGTGYVYINTFLKSGTTVTSPGADKNLLCIGANNSTKFIFDSDGDSFEHGTGWTAFDAYDDITLLDKVNTALLKAQDPIRSEFWTWVEQNAGVLQDLKLITFNDDGHHFINRSKMQELTVGAIRQLAERVSKLEGGSNGERTV